MGFPVINHLSWQFGNTFICVYTHIHLYIPGLEILLESFFTDTLLPALQIFCPTADEGVWPYDRVLAFLLQWCFFLLVPVPQWATRPPGNEDSWSGWRWHLAGSLTSGWALSNVMPRRRVLILCRDELTWCDVCSSWWCDWMTWGNCSACLFPCYCGIWLIHKHLLA